MPLDWFAPTGELLREFGAKPASILLVLGGIYGLVVVRPLRNAVNQIETKAIIVLLILLCLGILAGLLNFGLGWSSWDHARSPLSQMGAQSLLIIASGVAIVGNARLIRAYALIDLVGLVLPIAASIHLAVFLLEAFGVIQDSSGPLLLFRTDEGAIERPTGLFSEPSYFGTFAALYGSALLYSNGGMLRRLIGWVLAISLYVSAIAISAKTVVVVAGFQAVFLLLRSRGSYKKRLASAVVILTGVGTLGLYFVQNLSILNVEDNLSSSMRLGSTVLATNVALSGYGLTGIGIGQFHFFYRSEYAPDFLFLSDEGLSQMSMEASSRASTFNFFVRVLLEFGIAGFMLLCGSLRRLWRADLPPTMVFIPIIFSGSLGFLLTQDTYFYPPLVFSSAAILSVISRQQQRKPLIPVSYQLEALPKP